MGFEYLIIIGVFSLLGMLVGARLKSKMNHYSKVPISSGLTGAEVARKMLDYYNVQGVKIVQGQGFLTDHYNPATKTVSLSPVVYGTRSITAASVAAHECGHAVQHETGYSMLKLRSALVPFVQFGSRFYYWLIIAGIAMSFLQLAWLGVALFAATTLFSLITLPVEYDASNRALAWLEQSRVTRGQETDGAKDALKWAARTYLISALASIGQLLYWVFRLMGDSRR